MVEALILPSLQVPQQSVDHVGGKASQLSKIPSGQWEIPPWYVLTSEAWQQQCIYTGWARTWPEQAETLLALSPDSDEFKDLCEEKQLEIEDTPLISRISDSLAAWWEIAEKTPHGWAIRSSLAAEDARKSSFAGVMQTYLFQQNLTSICDSIRRCWASAFSHRALTYRLSHGVGIEEIRPAIMLQHMIPSEKSGVLFTANPLDGRRDEARIAAIPGVGEELVSGLKDAEEYTIALPHGQWKAMVQPFEQPVLTRPETDRLIRMGEDLAKHFGSPQDIEWTMWEDRMYVLQSRPITALPPPPYDSGSRRVWDNSNIQESYFGVTTPLTFSFASRAYATVYRQTMRIMGISEPTIAAHEPMLQNLLGLIRGRVYYNINNWYSGLLLLPSFRTNKADMERMMGVQDPVDFIEDHELSLWEKIQKLPGMLMLFIRMLNKFRQMNELVKGFLDMFESVVGKLDRASFHRLNLIQLMEKLQELNEQLLNRWQVPIMNDFFVMMYNGRVARGLEQAGLSADVQNRLLSGEAGIESTEPTKILLRLAQEVREQPELRTLIETDRGDLWQILKRKAPEFSAQCQAYIDRYGDRVMGELKLESISLRHNSTFLFQILRNYLNSETPDAVKLSEQEKSIRREAEQEVAKVMRGWKKRRFDRQLKRFRVGVRNRENMRLARTRLFGLYRDLYIEVGRRLAFDGVLEEFRDIFYLTVGELEAYCEGRSVSANLGELALLRKQEFQSYEAEDLPHQFSTLGPVYHHNTYSPPAKAAPVATSSLKGIGCYPGIIEAPVKVVLTPQSDLDLDGHILCAVRTDPGWAPLFPACKGILVERGSTLSHSAIVARELGIPAIVGIPGLTEMLQTGEVVRMDGTEGIVERREE